MLRRNVRRFAIAMLALAVPALAATDANWVSYDNHALVRVLVNSDAEYALLESISPDLWSESTRGGIDARIPPEQMAALEASGLQFRVLIPDIGPLTRQHLDAPAPRSDWDHYMDYAEMTQYMNNLAASYPNLCSVFSLGLSYEQRDIWALHITGSGASPKPAVFYHGVIHAREWIAGPMTLYLANYLLTNYGTDPVATELVDGLDIYLSPCVNPDGYIHSWSERMWRKNRRVNFGSNCIGVDLNRNWGEGWGGGGSSGDPCDLLYRGPSPFSEWETQALRDFIVFHPDILAYIDFHSFSQLILWPYGYTNLLPPEPDRTTFDTLGQEMQALIQSVHGEFYDQGPVYSTIYQASGGSVDWVYGDQGRIAYTIELRDTGYYGFVLPPQFILPNCEEILPAMLHLADWALDQAGTNITFPNGLPDVLTPAQPIDIDVEVFSQYESLVPGSPTLYYRYDGGAFEVAPLTHVSGDVYQAVLPPAACNDVPEFYFSAEGDVHGVVYEPAGAPSELLAVPVGEIVVAFHDDFETNQGWTVENLGATSGFWQRGVPVNDPSWEYDPISDSDGSGQCFVTQNQMGNTDVDDGAVRLTSPVFDMSSGGIIGYDYYLYLTNTGGGVDRLLVEINNNGGAGAWTEITRHDTDGGTSWRSHEISAAELAAAGIAPTANMKIRFTANDANPQSIVEAGIDAFIVQSFECNPLHGACCLSDGTCSVLTASDCAAAGGVYQGDGAGCVPSPCQSPWCVGDSDCSGGAPNFSDVEYFVEALVSEVAWADYYAAAHGGQAPPCPFTVNDINGGGVEFTDIGPFVQSLGGPCVPLP
jgi:murein tripeptide amidase MpaA